LKHTCVEELQSGMRSQTFNRKLIYIYIGCTQKVEHSWDKAACLYCKCVQETENGDELHRKKATEIQKIEEVEGQQVSKGLVVSVCLKTVGYLEG